MPFLRSIGLRLSSTFRDFVRFIKGGTFFDLALALVVGHAFTKLVESFVNDIFTPVFALLLTSQLSEEFTVIRAGPHAPYNTREKARSDGAITLNYGNFIQCGLDLVVMSISFYIIIKLYTAAKKKVIEEYTELLDTDSYHTVR